MKNRSENCWLMQSRMVTAVATISAQRHAPRKVRTRETSASCRPPMPACGSSNSMRFAPAAAAAAGMSSAGDETDDMSTPGEFAQLTALRKRREEPALFLKSVRHIGFLQRRSAGIHPARQERLVVGRRAGFAVIGPRRGQNRLPLQQRVVVGFLVVAP